jgi:Uncharacterized protein conserved in bacteria
MIRCALTVLAATGLALAAAPAAAADAYPSRPVTIVSPFPAGGATDTLTRLLAERMSQELGQSLVVENKAGAGTSIGASFVERAAPDGYTILMATNSTLVTNRFLYKDLPYDPDGYTPIGMVGIGPLVLLSSPKHDFASVADIVRHAKANPGKLSFASFGQGTSSHLAAEYFKDMAGLDMLHVPFRGATQALPVLAAGDVDLFFDMIATGMPQVEAGRAKVFAVTSKHRMPNLPQLPTLAESGFPGYEMTAWFSFVAPKGTPHEAVAKLQAALGAALKDDTVRKKMLDMGIDPRNGTAQELTDQIESEKPVIEKLVKQANIKLQ